MKKNSCVVCGSKRQRNLVFFPKYRLKENIERPFYPVWEMAKDFINALPFKFRVFDEEKNQWEGEYVCIRCLINPDSVSNIKDDNYFDKRRFGLKEKKVYRYRDNYEILEVLRYRYGN